MKNKFFVIAVAVVVLGVAVFIGLQKSTQSSQVSPSKEGAKSAGSFQVAPVNASSLIKFHSPSMGPSNAKVTIVEFLDPECEACGAMAPVVKKVMSEHKEDVRLVVRYMSFHQNSKLTANILEGARAQGKYWEALELLFATQSQWASHSDPKPELVPELLGTLGLDTKKIMVDARAGKYDKQILEDGEDGAKLGVNGTPTFFVNGYQLANLGYGPLKAAVVEALSR